MADGIEDPGARRSADALIRELNAVKGELAGFSKEADRLVAAGETAEKRAQTRARQEAAVRDTVRRPYRVRDFRTEELAEQRLARASGQTGQAVAEATRRLEAYRAIRQGLLNDLVAQTRRADLRLLGAQIDPALLPRQRPQQRLLPPPSAIPMPPASGPGQPYTRQPPAPPRPAAGQNLNDLLAQALGPAPGGGGGRGGGRPPGIDLDDLGDESDDLNRRFDRLRGRAGALTQEMGYLARQQALSADQMHRHGLMTTEFLSAAARGHVTVAELGTQIGGTIAKFAGWTLAASLTYGALAAVQQLGDGAIESLTGVNQLSRVVSNLDTGKAQGEFRQLSNEFNLPVGQVAEAAYEASKAFKDQNDAMAATEAALYGVKIGELDAANAGKFATAIVRGFKLEAEDLGDVMDYVNELQNQFGANFGQVLQGIAAAAGSVGAAGGSYQELGALIATGMQVTGKSGNELATSLRRTAETAYRPERRQRLIDLIGVDPEDTSFTELFRAAMRRVAEDPENARLAQDIAVAMSTPELASGRITPLLRSQALFEQRLSARETAPGSAERERRVLLSSAREEIDELGNNLNQIGAALAEVGATEGIAVMVRGLNLALDTTENLLAALKLIPEPIREAAFAAAPFVAAIALMRRFDTGGVLAGSVGNNRVGSALRAGLGRNPNAAERATITSGLNDEVAFSRLNIEEQDRNAARFRSMSLDATRRAEAMDELDERRERTMRSALRYDEQAEDAAADATYNRQRLADLERERVHFARETGPRGARRNDPRQAALDRGIVYASPLDVRPTTSTPINLQGGVGSSPYGPAVAAAGGAAAGRYSGLRAGGAAIGRGALAIGAALGPVELGIIAAFGLFEFTKYTLEQHREAKKAVDQIRRLPVSVDDPRELVRDAQDIQKKNKRGTFEFLNPKYLIGDPLGQRRIREDREAEEAARVEQAGRDIIAQNRRGRGFTRGQIQSRFEENIRGADDSAREIDAAVDQAIREVRQGRGALYGGKGKKDRARVKRDIAVFIEQIRNRAGDLKAVGEDLSAGLEDVNDLSGLTTFTGAFATRVGLYGARSGDVTTAGQAAVRARQLIANATKPEEFAAGLQIIEQLDQIVMQGIEDRMNLALAQATTPAQSARARAIGLRAQREVGVGALERRRNELLAITQQRPDAGSRSGLTTQQQKELDQLNEALPAARLADRLRTHEDRQTGADERLAEFDARTQRLVAEAPEGDREGVQQRRLRQRVQLIRRRVDRGLAQRADLDIAIADMLNAASEDSSDALAMFQARQQLATAQLAAGGASEETLLARAVTDAQAYAEQVRQASGRDSVDFINAQRVTVDAQKALRDYNEQQAQALVSGRAELATSRTDDPVQQARIREREAQQLVRFAKTPAERMSALATVNNSRRERQQAVLDQRTGNIDFDLEMEKIDQQTAISRFETLLKTMKLSKEQKRDLKRRIHGLRKELEGDAGSFDLDVSDIRLPTAYDVRRMVRQGTRTASSTLVQQSNQVTIQVNGADEPERVADETYRQFSTHTGAAMRSGGLF